MALGYRAIVRLDDSDDAIIAAESQLLAWLREKKQKGTLETADWDGEGEFRLGSNARLTVVHDTERPDGSCRRLYRLIESNNRGTFTVSLYALSVPRAKSFPNTLVVDVELDVETVDQAIRTVAPPRLMRRILDSHRAFDGRMPLTGEPQVVRKIDVDTVQSAILDQARTASVIVAPLPWPDDEEKWRALIRELTSYSVGVASTFILDEAATAILQQSLPQSHQIEKGVIRTFAPKVDIESPEDSLRHPKLYPKTLIRYIRRGKVRNELVGLHAHASRLRFIERDLPGDVRRGLDILARVHAEAQRNWDLERKIVDAQSVIQTQEPRQDPAVATPMTRLSVLINRWLGDDWAISDSSLTKLDELLERRTFEAALRHDELNKAAEVREKLENNIRELRAQVENLSLDLAVAEEERRKYEREVVVLRQRLVASGRVELVYVEREDSVWDPPDDILNLLERITPGSEHIVFSRVEFTGDEDKALEVDVYEPTPRYAHAFWDFIHVLYDYAEGRAQGRISGGVHHYLTNDEIVGHKCAPSRHAPKESETTLKRWGSERIFSVPTSVNPSGKVLMEAHFKPTWRDAFAPRMYYYDDTNGTGKIYIGYIGRHLTNTKTS